MAIRLFEMQELDKLEEQLAPLAGNSGGDYETRVQYLRLLRKLRLRRSDSVVLYGRELVKNPGWARKLGSELWDVYEQVALAALDIGDLELAQECGNPVARKFPKSQRVSKMEGMLLEAQEEWEEADRVYKETLEETPGSHLIHKRRVAALKSQGNLTGAAEALNSYLDTFQADAEGWRELAEIYIKLQQYRHAAYCYEEVLVTQPQNSLIHLAYAEVLYTMGGVENFKLARKYYAAAVKISSGKNVRALYGVIQSAAAVAAATKGKRGEPESTDLPRLAADVLKKEYKENCPSLLGVVTRTLDNQVAQLS